MVVYASRAYEGRIYHNSGRANATITQQIRARLSAGAAGGDLATGRLGDLDQVGGSASRQVARESKDAKRRGTSESRLDPGDFRGVHLREAEALLAEVLEGGADKVEFLVVDDHLSTNARASHSWPS